MPNQGLRAPNSFFFFLYSYPMLHGAAFRRFVLKSECSQLSSTPPRSLWGSFTTSPGIITRFSFSPSFSLLNAPPPGCLANYNADFLLLQHIVSNCIRHRGRSEECKKHSNDKKQRVTIISHVHTTGQAVLVRFIYKKIKSLSDNMLWLFGGPGSLMHNKPNTV